jgi:hypothetical protein
MNSEKLIEMMQKVEDKGLPWEEVEEKIKVPHQILKLYMQSGPVPVTIINNLTKVLEEAA